MSGSGSDPSSRTAAGHRAVGRSARLGRGQVVAVLALVVGLAFPLVVTNPAWTSIAVFTTIYIACASAWNMFSGYSGYMALGNAAFYGTGAYTMANAAKAMHLAGGIGVFGLIPLAGIAAGIVAVPVGWLALRTRRHTFVVITIAIFFIFQLLAYNLTGLTNGSAGMELPMPTWTAATYNNYFYYVGLALAVVAVGASWAVRRSRFGLELLAIRDDEDRARGLGVPAGRVKLAAFVGTAVITGMCGGLYAYFIGSIYPPFAFEAIFDVTVALMTFLGGLGSITGPVLGALVLEPVQQYFTLQFSNNGLYLILYGILFLLVIRYLPLGVVPTIGKWWRGRAVVPAQAGAAPPAQVSAPSGEPEAAAAARTGREAQ